MAKPKVTIYSTTTCVYCRAEKNFLEANRVDFTEVMVDQDEQEANQMIQLSGQMGVPFTVVKTADKEEHILGFDQQRLSTALGL